MTDIASKNNFDYVVCGHIHQPCIKNFKSKNKNVTYLNSGDWIENMTALEYCDDKWSLFEYDPLFFKDDTFDEQDYKDAKALFSDLVKEIQ